MTFPSLFIRSFNDRVVKDPSDPVNGCWLWIGSISPTGYGQSTTGGHAHRASWRIHRGEIPDELCVLHRCDVRPCVNPDHLFLGTRTDNSKDMVAKGRQSSGERHSLRCTRGPEHSRIRKESASKGDDHHTSKLTIKIVKECRKRRKDTGCSFGKMAKEYGVTKATMRRAVVGITWSHIT